MAGSALHSRVLLWNLLATRRDIDLLTLELIGKHQIDRDACDISSTREHLAFDLVCHLEIIFDLQRIHLQARTPYNGALNRIANRLPYLLSLSTAKGAFMCLVKLAADHPDWAQVGDRRRIFIRALQSGVRMLGLHPKVGPEEILSKSVRYDQNLNLQSLNAEEGLLTRFCHRTLQKPPITDPNLFLPTSAMNMYPINDGHLDTVARDCVLNFADDSMRRYWTLYDISWSIVAACIQCLANNPNRTDDGITTLASSIVKYTIEKIKNLLENSTTTTVDINRTLLLADIVGILHPILVLKGEVVDDAWRCVYTNVLDDSTDRDSVYEDRTYFSALSKLRQSLMQRQKVLRDSDDDIQAICSSIPRECLAAVHKYNSQPVSSVRDPRNLMRFFVANCEKSHIIAYNDGLSRLISENASHTSADLIVFPQVELCPVCRALDQAKTYTHLREILPLNEVLSVINQKNQELERLRLQRQSDFLGEARETADMPERRPPSQQPKHNTGQQPKPEPLSLKTPGGLGLSHYSSMAGLRAMLSPKKKNRLSGESSTLGSRPSSTKSEASIQEIKFNHLSNSREKNITLSADGSISVFWNKEQLEVHNDRGHKFAVSQLVANPILVTASTNCCAVVGQTENHNRIECYNLHTGLLCYKQDFGARVRCLAMSANDFYLAVGLNNGIIYIIDLVNQDILKEELFEHKPPESAVHCLSFPANRNELIITIRFGEKVHIYNYPIRDGPWSHRLTCSLSKHESDDQGISSSLYSQSKELYCITSWTNKGVPLLYDWARKESVPWNRKLDDLKVGNRIYLAVWSSSGKILVLVDSSGIVYKIIIHHINFIEATEIARTRPMNRKSYDVGQPQFLDVKISQDETQIIIAWISTKNQAFIRNISVDPSHTGANKSFFASPSS